MHQTDGHSVQTKGKQIDRNSSCCFILHVSSDACHREQPSHLSPMTRNNTQYGIYG